MRRNRCRTSCSYTFLFDNTLGEESLVKLYRKVCERRLEEPEIWREYRREIEDFGLRKLLAGEVSRSLAPIYEALLWNGMIDEKLAAVLPRILQTQYVAAPRAEDRRLVAVYPELEEEETADFLAGEAYLPIYSPQALLLTEDSAGNRRAPKGLERKALFDLPQYLAQCEALQPEQPAVLLRKLDELLQRASEANENLDDEGVRTLRFGLEHMPLAENCKGRIRAALLANKSRCEGYLQRSDKADFTEKERAEIFRCWCSGKSGRRPMSFCRNICRGRWNRKHWQDWSLTLCRRTRRRRTSCSANWRSRYFAPEKPTWQSSDISRRTITAASARCAPSCTP